MLSLDELKSWLHRDISKRDKLLLILAALEKPSAISEVRDLAYQAGLKINPNSNPSASLSKAKGLVIRTPSGWEITDSGKQHLRNIGVSKLSPAAVKVAVDLRHHLENITNKDTQKFAEEAIKCYEAELYRSAIVMSWLSAVHLLHTHVVENCLSQFNQEAKRVDAKWKDAQTTDDLGMMKESDFLDRLVAISIIGKNTKKELKECLDRRNGCGHPNSLRIGPNTAAHQIEILLLNVFQRF